MRCQKCGSNWIEKSTVQTGGDGLTHEWLCKKCGSAKMEEREMSRRGTCVKCGRENMTLPGHGLCGKCYTAARKEKKEKPPTQTNAQDPGPAAGSEVKMKALPPCPDIMPPAPSNGNGLFPPLTIKFEERDNALVDALESEAVKQRRTPTQQILYLLERHYGLTP